MIRLFEMKTEIQNCRIAALPVPTANFMQVYDLTGGSARQQGQNLIILPVSFLMSQSNI